MEEIESFNYSCTALKLDNFCYGVIRGLERNAILLHELFHSGSKRDMQLDVPVLGLSSVSIFLVLKGSLVDACDAISVNWSGMLSLFFYYMEILSSLSAGIKHYRIIDSLIIKSYIEQPLGSLLSCEPLGHLILSQKLWVFNDS